MLPERQIEHCVIPLREEQQRRFHMPVLLIPILWTAGGVAVLGGGYYVITHMIH